MAKRATIKTSELRRLAMLQCTLGEVASVLHIGTATLKDILETDERAKRVWEEGQAVGKISLRRKQMRLAGHSAPMAIFLGKQLLLQKDVVVNELSGRDGGPVQVMDLTKLSNDERKKLRTILERSRSS